MLQSSDSLDGVARCGFHWASRFSRSVRVEANRGCQERSHGAGRLFAQGLQYFPNDDVDIGTPFANHKSGATGGEFRKGREHDLLRRPNRIADRSLRL